jgi:phosphoesterase RecJ-like protein
VEVSLEAIGQKLREKQNILILTHQNPDGDTLGSGTALYYALKQMGKQACVLCSDPFPLKFGYLFEDYQPEEFHPDLVVSVDVADKKLLGKVSGCYADQIEIAIDHHISNRINAPMLYVDPKAAATCEVIYELILTMGVKITKEMANCLYTGIITDTGCFKFSNTTPRTHKIAAELMELQCDFESINRKLFDTKSKGQIEVERAVLDSMEFYQENRVALVVVPQKLVQESGIDSADLDGIAAIPRQIEGVEVGITMKERPEGGYKVSVRTCRYADASAICGKLGGGGHVRAAGCAVNKPLEEAKKLILDAAAEAFE